MVYFDLNKKHNYVMQESQKQTIKTKSSSNENSNDFLFTKK